MISPNPRRRHVTRSLVAVVSALPAASLRANSPAPQTTQRLPVTITVNSVVHLQGVALPATLIISDSDAAALATSIPVSGTLSVMCNDPAGFHLVVANTAPSLIASVTMTGLPVGSVSIVAPQQMIALPHPAGNQGTYSVAFQFQLVAGTLAQSVAFPLQFAAVPL